MSEKPVLELETWLPYQCSVIVNLVSAQLAQLYEGRFGMTSHGWRMMAVLGRAAPLSAIELARMTAMDQVSVTRAISHLVDLGLVVRRTDAKDRRKVALRLSAKGRKAYETIVPRALELEENLLDGLTNAEVENVRRLMGHLFGNAVKLGL